MKYSFVSLSSWSIAVWNQVHIEPPSSIPIYFSLQPFPLPFARPMEIMVYSDSGATGRLALSGGTFSLAKLEDGLNYRTRYNILKR